MFERYSKYFVDFCRLLKTLQQFEPRSGLTECRFRSGSKPFDTIDMIDLIVYLKEFF